MRKDNNGARKSGDFLAGKGFYIVLFACIAIIGVSAWILAATGGTTDPIGEVMTQAPIQQEPPPRVTPPPNEQHRLPQLPTMGDADTFSPHVPEEPPEPPPEEPPSVPTMAEEPEVREDEAETPPPRQRTIEELTFVWPVLGNIEMPFSVDMPIYHRTLAVWRTHPGIDIAAAIGTRVLAIADGTVVDVFEDDMLGTTVVIDHGNYLQSIYANLARTPVVSPGDNVAMGAVIGAVGDTAIGEIREVAHLHLEMTLNGEPANPEDFLPNR